MRAVQCTSLRSSIARLLVLVLRRIFVGLHLYLSSGGGVLVPGFGFGIIGVQWYEWTLLYCCRLDAQTDDMQPFLATFAWSRRWLVSLGAMGWYLGRRRHHGHYCSMDGYPS